MAQTRLENRTYRPNVELCRDIPQYQLCYEVGEIDGSIKALIEKLQTAESALQNLNEDLARIEDDLAVKTNSLTLDNKCMETRQKLTNPDFVPDKDVDGVTEGLEKLSAAGERAFSPPEIVDRDITPYQAVAAETSHQRGPTAVDKAMTMDQGVRTGSRSGKDGLETTYNASYEIGGTNLRSGDLARTLGKSTGVERYSASKGRRDLLVD